MDAEERNRAEIRHRALAELLGAYADGELRRTEAESVEAHLAGCDACRRELGLQRAVRSRLGQELPEAAPPALWSRVAGALDRQPPVPPERGRANLPSLRRALPWVGWLVAAVLGGVLLRGGPPSPPAPAARPPMVEEALADFARLHGVELPAEPGGIPAVQERLGFAVHPLSSPEASLIGAWTTEIRRQPAAVLAYRWRDRVILQYVVSEELFFRQPVVRERVASEGRFVVREGARSVVAWPQRGSGSLLVGEAEPAALERLRS